METLAVPLIVLLFKAAEVVVEGEESEHIKGEGDTEPVCKTHLLLA